MALLSSSQAAPTPSTSVWRRWLNPRDPRGTTLWGTAAMSVAWGALYALHGSPSEVWPNRCALLRAQLEAEPRYALTASELTPPSLLEGLTLERAHLQRGASGLKRVVFEGRELKAEGAVTRVSALLTSLPSGLITRLTSALDLSSEALVALPSPQRALTRSPAALTRLGLSTTPRALSCAPDQLSRELPLALGLLLKGGVISPQAPLEAVQVGRWGALGWWMTEAGEARFWRPLSQSASPHNPLDEPQADLSVLVWQRGLDAPLSSAHNNATSEPLTLLTSNPQDTSKLAQLLLSATAVAGVEALLSSPREESAREESPQ